MSMNDNGTEYDGMLSREEIDELLNVDDKSSCGEYMDSPRENTETTATELPHIEISDVLGIEPVNSCNGQQYEDGCLYRIRMNSGHDYFIRIENMPDPSWGLFGAFGSWTPFHTILLDETLNRISEHYEDHGAASVRIRDIIPGNRFHIETDPPHKYDKEQIIRWLTVMNMITSNYLSEIQDINREIIKQYQIGCEVNRKLRELYERRFAYTGKMMNWSMGAFEDIEEIKKSRKDLE
ncbi:MAG: hypothetical protein K5668_01115, partial [Lachnospiraceae bacterium]|nr:hypothetical protein [Lachnospiraceae bacterium]